MVRYLYAQLVLIAFPGIMEETGAIRENRSLVWPKNHFLSSSLIWTRSSSNSVSQVSAIVCPSCVCLFVCLSVRLGHFFIAIAVEMIRNLTAKSLNLEQSLKYTVRNFSSVS